MSTLDKSSRLKNITVENNQVILNYEGATSDTYPLSGVNRIKIELAPTVYVDKVDSRVVKPNSGGNSGGGSGGGSGSGSGSSDTSNLTYGWYNNNYKVDAAIDEYVVHYYNFGAQTVGSHVKKLVLD